MDFDIPTDHRVKLKNKKSDKQLDLARELKKDMEQKCDSDTN